MQSDVSDGTLFKCCAGVRLDLWYQTRQIFERAFVHNNTVDQPTHSATMSSRSVMSPLGTLPSVVMIRDVGSMPRSSSEPPPSKRDEFFDADAEDNASVSTLGFDDFESAMASSDNLIYAPYRPRRSGSWGYRAYNIGVCPDPWPLSLTWPFQLTRYKGPSSLLQLSQPLDL
jgi:hypothetical protein